MKLKLDQQNDIGILEIFEEVSKDNVTVLKAGVSKLFKSGKNKIILNLIEAKQLSMDVVQEIVNLHIVASELNGRIVMVGQGDLVKQVIQNYASPPPLKYYSTVDAALRSFVDEKSGTSQQPKEKIDPNDPIGSLKQLIAQLEQENKSLKGKIASLNLDEVKKLKFENGAYNKQLTIMEEQIKTLTKERKKPFELESLNIKIQQLEEALETFIANEAKAAVAAVKKAG